MNNYAGTIIEESLENKDVLKRLNITSTKIEKVTDEHQTPWLSQWTLHAVEIPENEAEAIAKKISDCLDYSHGSSWYADFKNDRFHYIIYRGKIFKIDLRNPLLYKDAKQYGMSLGIPEYQVDFAPEDKTWER